MKSEDLVNDLRERLKETDVTLQIKDLPDIDIAPEELIVTLGIIVFCCDLKPGFQFEGSINSDQVEWALEQADDTDEFLELYAKNCLEVDIKNRKQHEGDEEDDDDEL